MRGEICITGIQAKAYHGVYDFERETGQLFVADVILTPEVLTAQDELQTTVDYGAVAKDVYEQITGKPVSLLETLSGSIARYLARKYAVSKAEVRIHKPQAPIEVPFSDVSVTAIAEWTEICLGLGSNMGDRQGYLDLALQVLQTCPDVRDIVVSDRIETKPYGEIHQADFLNACVRAKTLLTPEELLCLCQSAEQKAQRVREKHWGPRTLDVDILLYGDAIISTPSLTIPHADMINRMFVLSPLRQIAGGVRHPVCNATVEMLYQALRRRESEAR